MHYFSLHTEDDEHVGFLIMYPHEDSHNQSGDLAVKLREDLPDALRRHVQVLAEWEKQPALSWAVEGDKVDVWDGDGDIRGRIRAEYLTIGNHTFVLNDLTGAV